MKQKERRARTREAKPVAELVERVLTGYHVAEDVRKRRILTLWSRIVGARIAANTEPGRIVDGVLNVQVRTSSWMQELSFIADDLVARINSAVGDPPLVHSLRFRLGPPRYPKPRPLRPDRPRTGALVRPRPASADRQATITRESGTVEDAELREIIASVRRRYDL